MFLLVDMAEHHYSKQKFKWFSLKRKSGIGVKNSRFSNSSFGQLFRVWSKRRRKSSSILERKYKTKKSQRHTGGPCMDLDFKCLLQVSDNLNQPSLAAEHKPSRSGRFSLHCQQLLGNGGLWWWVQTSPSGRLSSPKVNPAVAPCRNCSIGGWQKQWPHYW